MKRKLLSIFLAFAMSVSLLTVGASAVEPTYGDIAGHWAEASIDRWSGHGIIQGNNGKFNPNGQLTCAHFAAILARLLKLPAATDAGFSDNTPDAWHYDAINRCAAAGILKGGLNGTVTPNAPITRERAMVMLGRALGIEPIENPDLTRFADGAQVAPYAQGMLAALIEAGVVGGVTADQLAPQNNITRAATVTILDRSIGTYADKAGETVAADGKGIVLVVADDVTVTGEVNKLLVPANDIEVTVKGSKNIDDITVSGDNSKIILDNGSANDVTLDGEKSAVETKNGAKIDNVIMSENASGATVDTGSGTTVGNVENHAEDTSITGSGTVKKVESDKDITVKTKDTDIKNIGDEKIAVTDKNGKDTTVGTTGSGSSATVNKGTTSSGGGGGGGSSSGSSHSHSYADAWSYDDTYHWHASTCGHDVVSGKAEHTYGEDHKCTVCGSVDPAQAVASINGKNYLTLAEAITAAKADDTITLLADVSNAGDIVLPAGVTLNGGGHKISGASTVRLNAAGGTVQNVMFETIHNESNGQSAICASALTGTLTVTGCTFDNVDWDAIQITPKANAAIVITNNVFKHTDESSTQQRYIHIESTENLPYNAVMMTITDNQFFKTAKTAERIASIAPFYVQAAAGSKLNGNYVEDRTTVIAGYGVSLDEYYPMRGQADTDNDDVTAPKYVASNEDGKQYLTLAAAVEDAKATVNANKNATIKLECDVQEDIELSDFTGSGDVLLNLNGKTLTGNVVVSNETVIVKIVDFDAASKIDGAITNSGKADLNISTYGIVTGVIEKNSDGTIIIDKGTFSEKPNDAFIKAGYFAMNVDGKWRVGEKSDEGAAAMGFAVRAGSGSKARYYKTFADAVNADEQSLVLLADQREIDATTQYDTAYGNFTVTLNNHSFEGTLASTYIGISIRGSGQATFRQLTVPAGKPFTVFSNAVVTLNDAEVGGDIKVGTTATDTAKLTITGGTYTGAITVGRNASLVITGGTFSSDPSAYVATDYTATKDESAGTWTVSADTTEP